MIVMPRLLALTTVWVVLFALLSNGTALAQDEGSDDEGPVEVASYGDSELIEALRTYGLLDEWIQASPVSPQASLLRVTSNGGYQAQRQTFLNSLETWANRTESVRNDLARIDGAQANADRLRSVANQVRDALALDDRLASDSKTLLQIEDALGQLASVQIPEHPPAESPGESDPLGLAEVQLGDLWKLAETELAGLNGREPAVSSSGPGAFVGYDDLLIGLNHVDQLLARSRRIIRPAREQSERLASSALAQIPKLHAARMLGSSDVRGLSIVTVDAYIRAAQRSSCSVDWALLAGIGRIESNHGRLGGASVSRSGQVSTTILGPLLDGGETEREAANGRQTDEPSQAVTEVAQAGRRAAQAAAGSSLWNLLRSSGDGANVDEALADQGNGFAVVIDSDGGRLDGNDQWDRAIGPMQFLPETWSKWATDGNGDGVSDPHNLYDAAAAAGRFLCDLSRTRSPSPSSFVLGYNASTSYVRSVLATAQALRSTSLPAA